MRELYERYLKNKNDRTVTLTTASLIVNGFIGAGKMILGVCLSSTWLIINAAYYLILFFARMQALRKYKKCGEIKDPQAKYDTEFTFYRHSGGFIWLIGFSYLLVCIRMYFAGDSTLYTGSMVYLTAAVSFTKLGFAIYGTAINRHLKDPVISLIKRISFTDAIVSIVVTQCTLLAFKGSPYAVTSSAMLGMAASFYFMFEGLRMLCKKKKR